jgi:2Fe-2S ferredoxin
MPTITYISPDGTRKEVEVENGYSVMEGAINNNIDGIVAECGGACACATCHSYIDEAWLDKIPPMDDMEDSMLDAAFERKPNSRLTCPPGEPLRCLFSSWLDTLRSPVP